MKVKKVLFPVCDGMGGDFRIGKDKLVFLRKGIGIKTNAETYQELTSEDDVIPWARKKAKNIK